MHPVDPETRRVQKDPAYLLAEIVGSDLRQLPVPRAPHTLLPRVMAAVQEWARRPWYTRAWRTWPLGWQAASIAALVVLGISGVLFLPNAQAAVVRVASTYGAGVAGDFAGIAGRVELTRNAAATVWRAVVQPFAVYAVAFVALMWLACAAFGAALNHVIFGRTVRL